MTKAPAFQFYPLDFLQGTKLMTLAERGAYITLLCEQWDGVTISGRAEDLAKVLRVGRKEATRLWSIVHRKFTQQDDGTWQNERLERERHKQEARRKALARNGAQGGRGKAKPKLTESNSFSNAKANGKQNESLKRLSLSSSALQDLDKEHPDPGDRPSTTMTILRGRFDAFWAEYPKKAAKGHAWKAWQRIKPTPELTVQMLAAVRQQRSSRQWRDGFIPNPATWLNGEQWSDEPVIQVESSAPMPFWDECAKCGDIHPVGQACSEKA